MLLAAWYHTILGVLFAFTCLLIILVILLQRGRGGGLSGAFGGMGGAASTAFGSKTGDMLTWITVGGAIIFLLFTVALNFVFRPSDADLEDTAPPATPPPAQPAVPPASVWQHDDPSDFDLGLTIFGAPVA